MHAKQITITLAAFAAFSASTAQVSAQDAGAAFSRLDADQSGTISWAEAYKVRVGQFMDMDADMDGIVTEAEFQGPARPLSAFDTDGDKELHLAEFLQGHRSMFDRFDEDASGSLTLEEFEAAQSAARSQ